MHRTRAAERHEREVARLDPLLDGQRADRLRHLGVRHVADALGQLARLEPQLAAQLRDRRARRLDVERHRAAREAALVHAAEHEVGVGDGRPRAAAAVARGSRVGAGALRPDAQAARLGVGQRAAARPDRVDVDDRHHQREPLQLGLRGDVRGAVDDERDVEARPAHVDADQVAPPEQASERDAAHRAPDGPREQRLEGQLARRLRGHDAAARLHHVQRDGEPARAQLGLEPLEVAAHDRGGVGVDHRRGRALVLAPLARDPVRQRDRRPVELRAQDRLRPQLVLRVHVREQEGDGDRAEALVAGAARGRADRVLVERLDLLARGVEPPADLDDVRPRHQRPRLAEVDVVEPRPVAAGDVEHVAGAARGEQQHALAAPLQERVEPLRGAVDGEGDVARRPDDLLEAGEHAGGQVGRRRRRLARRVGARVLVVGDDVGERAADVHRDAVAAHGSGFPAASRMS